MTTEEKAKAYDKAFERAKQWCNAPNVDKIPTFANRVIKEIFPELSESEDERIRKEIISALKYANVKGVYDKHLAWLEKQGEQKVPVADFKAKDWYASKVDGKIRNIYHSVDKVEPKFKVGDWITNGATKPAQISSIEDDMYYTHNGTIGGDIESIDKDYHLWTIADAKDGDVLVHNNIIFIFMGIKKGIVKGITELSDTILNFGNLEYDNDYCPATKEQRDTLIKAMTDAGYTFDFEKKELKILNNNS